MTEVTIEDAKDRLPSLIGRAIDGDTIVIRQGAGRAVRLVPDREPATAPR